MKDAVRTRYYLCIDMKTFYASVECAERGLNPFETDLAVADVGRGKNGLCLAITPKMKSRGIQNRCRLSDIPKDVRPIVVPPRMQLYIDYTADIYGMYLDYFSPDDIYVYSIDESFIDVTDYLKIYRKTPRELASDLLSEIGWRFRIPATAGIGTNLYLAKIALDIVAKHAADHIGYLDEQTYRDTLWTHRPITDFWHVAAGTARRLARLGVYDMRGVTFVPEELMYKVFGKDAELLIDHAWGRESCLIEDIKNYKSKSKSVSFSQILPRSYTAAEARTVLREMVYNGCEEMLRRKVITHKVGILVGYANVGDREGGFDGGTVNMTATTNLPTVILPYAVRLYDSVTDARLPVRRLGLCFEDVCDAGCENYDFFTNFDAVDREKLREEAILDIRSRYGKNAVMRGLDYFAESTQVERNTFIGGHRAGYGDLPADRQRGTDRDGRPLRGTGDVSSDDVPSGTGEAVHGVRRDEGPFGGTA